MNSNAQLRLSRELFMAAFGGARPENNQAWSQNWVTDRLASLLEEEELHAGQVIYYAGDPPDYLYMVRNGRIRMSRPRQRLLDLRGPLGHRQLRRAARPPAHAHRHRALGFHHHAGARRSVGRIVGG